MVATNVGGLDRIIRVDLGHAPIAPVFPNTDASMLWLYLIGIVTLATGLPCTCPPYSMSCVSFCTAGLPRPTLPRPAACPVVA